jgi:hypothetical protein
MQATSPDRPTKKKGNVVDGTQFDTLVKRLSTTTLSRSTALRGLAASIAAFAGVTVGAEPGAAEERKICHCPGTIVADCRTLKLTKKKAKRHLNQHACDLEGRCNGVSGCPPGSCKELGDACSGDDTECCSGHCTGFVCAKS